MIFKILLTIIVCMIVYGAYKAFRGVLADDIEKSEEQVMMGLWIVLSGCCFLFLIAVLWIVSWIAN